MKKEAPAGVRFPFFTKTVLTFLAPLVLSIAVLGFFSVKNTVDYVNDNVEKVNSTLLKQTRDKIDSIMDELNTISLNFTINGKVQYSLKKILQKEFLAYEDLNMLEIILNMLGISHYSRSYLNSIYVYFDNPKRNFITSEADTTSLDTFHDTGWYESYKNAESGRADWCEVRSIRNSRGTPGEISVLTFYKLVYNSNSGKYNGVVVFNVSAEYIRSSLRDLKSFDHQTIYILDAQNNVIASNDNGFDFLLPQLLGNRSAVFEILEKGKRYTVSQLKSKHDYTYISIVPNEALYSLPDYISRLNALYILISLVIGVSLSVYLARRSSNQILTIIEIIEAAKNGHIRPLGNVNPIIKNSYQYILYNIINTFLEKDYLRIQLSEKQYKSRVNELVALQAQMNPHFLFNTLQTINMRVLGLGSTGKDIGSMIEDLSMILRYSMSDPRSIVLMEEEIANAKSYIAIQTIRYKGKMRVSWQYEESILPMKTIKLLFQPLIENCIYHGLKEKEAGGEILISIREEENCLKIVVADTGIGIEPGRLREIQDHLSAPQREDFEHIGLYNTNRRIQLVFGDEYGLSVTSTPGNGTTVDIRLPITTAG